MDKSRSAETAPDSERVDIAIIGMAGRFPGARNIDEYWANLQAGVESIRTLTDAELLAAGVPRRDLDDPTYVKRCPVLDDIDKFDAAFFRISPRDASVMDPAHRFFLEVAWQALEHSGNSGLPQEGRVGVFATSGAPWYWMDNVRTHRDIMESMGEFLVRHTGNDMNFLATRASYDLDLRGPSINVQTACSSALVAAHMARISLMRGECDMALVGGSSIALPMGHGYHYKEGEILSPDGHCRPFDHKSAGTVFGSGSGCLVFKRLGDALDNGDTIHAVLKGSAVNNDGSVKVGFLAPGVEGQVGVIRDALAAANATADSISYVETHGTGTSVGDPIELTALEHAYSEQTQRKQFCGIGSVKSNIGHLGEAAGIAALIKVVLAFKHRKLPATLGYERPNPRFDLENSPFFVQASLGDWQAASPLRCGVTGLGAGGTNCHLILEEPPKALAGEGDKERQLLVLSARSKAALDRACESLATCLEREPQLNLADVAYTLCMGRRPLPHRRVLVARDHAEAIALLRGAAPTRIGTASADTSDPSVVFTFPGGGAQYARMCFDLYQSEPVFREALDECLAVVDRELGRDLRPLLFAAAEQAEASTRALEQPSLTLPTLFSVEFALARLFESYGIKAAAYVGHSMGEYVAACLAGVFSMRDGLRLVGLRGRLFEKVQRGNMIGVPLSEAELRALMPAGLSIAAVNAPELCVASGASHLIEELRQTLTSKEIDWTPIHIDVAAHSSLLDPILAEFRAIFRTIELHAPQAPIASNLTGRWLTAAEATDPEYWVKHLRNTVRFADCIETVLQGGNRVFLEIGPGRTMTSLVAAQKTKVRNPVNSVRHPKEPANDVDYALLTLGKVWAAGATVDWTLLYDGQLRNRVPLPSYPFEGESYWLAPMQRGGAQTSELVKRENIDSWFYGTTWEQAPLVKTAEPPAKSWLLFVDHVALGNALSRRLAAELGSDVRVVRVHPGKSLRRINSSTWELDLASAADYRGLFDMLEVDGTLPEHVVYALGVGSSAAAEPIVSVGLAGHLVRLATRVADSVKADSAAQQVEARIASSFFGPTHLAKAMGATLGACQLTLVTRGAFAVSGESQDPLCRLSVGPAQVIARELPDIKTRHVDLELDLQIANHESVERCATQLMRELLAGGKQSPVALRAPRRWVRRVHPMALPPAESPASFLSEGDVVFITGGLGGIGLVVAEHLARSCKIKLALLSRSGLPSRSQWRSLLDAPDTERQVRQRIEQVKRLEALGSRVLCVEGDVAVESSLAGALSRVRSELGPLSTVIHAAGVMDDGPLQTKTDESMSRVLAPKVQGTRNLDALITEDLRAFVVMSSVASVLGLPGQIDYTAANAFLDAFAEDRDQRKPGRTLAINWNAWRDVGMIVDFGARSSSVSLPDGRCTSDWLDAFEPTDNGRRFFTDFGVASHWLLAEHRVRGADSLIPGTGFVELARAAFCEMPDHSGEGAAAQSSCVELSSVAFLSPFRVLADRSRRLQIELERVDDGYSVSMTTAGHSEVHMTAQVARRSWQAPPLASIAAIRARCPKIEAVRDGFLDQAFVEFGPRWGNLRSIALGNGEALLELALPAAFATDLAGQAFHPALMDMATGAAQPLITGFARATDFYVPFGYDRIRIFEAPTTPCFSHVTLRSETPREVAAFDITLMDASGRALIAIEGFTMKCVRAGADFTTSSQATAEARNERSNALVAALLRDAITPAEGIVAFDRAMSQRESFQVIASSLDVNLWQTQLESEASRLAERDVSETGSSFSRPALSSDYVAPSSPMEIEIAAMWSKLLGVSQVGVFDDFFEIGGNSLIALRLFARLKKHFAISLPLSTLFQAPTIRALADALREQGYVEPQVATDGPADATSNGAASTDAPSAAAREAGIPPPVLIRPGGDRAPLFFVHDGLGETLLYRTLALKLSPAHAVYGLQPEVTADASFAHTRIVDMAAAKVQRIRSVQPHGPYLLAGLCAGGVIAFEVARQLQDANERVAFVGIIDAADVAAKERRFRTVQQRLDRFMGVLTGPGSEPRLQHLTRAVPQMIGKAANLARYELESRAERRRNARTVQQLREQAAAAAAASTQGEDLSFLKVYEVAHHEHTPSGVFSGGDVVLFRATQGDGSLADVPFREVYADDLMGWQSRVRGAVQAIDIPGGHSSALQEPNAHVLARELQQRIDAALAKTQRA